MKINRAKTAIKRRRLSAPFKRAIERRLITKEMTILDYGCGRGEDVKILREQGYQIEGYDPAFFPNTILAPADVVNLSYVIDIIEDLDERKQVLQNAWQLARKRLIITSLVNFNKGKKNQPYGDGVVTQQGTFHADFTDTNLRIYLEHHLEVNVTSLPELRGCCYIEREAQKLKWYLHGDAGSNGTYWCTHCKTFMTPNHFHGLENHQLYQQALMDWMQRNKDNSEFHQWFYRLPDSEKYNLFRQ